MTNNLSIKNNCSFLCTQVRFYAKKKEKVFNYYKSYQHRSCNTRSDQGPLQASHPVPDSGCFPLWFPVSPSRPFDPWLLPFHYQLSLTTTQPLHFLSLRHLFPQRAQHLCGINKHSTCLRKRMEKIWKCYWDTNVAYLPLSVMVTMYTTLLTTFGQAFWKALWITSAPNLWTS